MSIETEALRVISQWQEQLKLLADAGVEMSPPSTEVDEYADFEYTVVPGPEISATKILQAPCSLENAEQVREYLSGVFHAATQQLPEKLQVELDARKYASPVGVFLWRGPMHEEGEPERWTQMLQLRSPAYVFHLVNQLHAMENIIRADIDRADAERASPPPPAEDPPTTTTDAGPTTTQPLQGGPDRSSPKPDAPSR